MIIEMRKRNGPFRCVEELRALPRLSDKQYDKVRERIEVSGPSARADCAAASARR